MGRQQTKNKQENRKKSTPAPKTASASWVDNLRFVATENEEGASGGANDHDSSAPVPTISILSWNVLAEAYCSRHSQVHLPKQYQKVVFSKSRRRELILNILTKLCVENAVDVVCLQELDLPEVSERLQSLGYAEGVETPRVVGGGSGGRTDACAVYVRGRGCTVGDEHGNTSQWQLVDHEILRLDDLATLSTAAAAERGEEGWTADTPGGATACNTQGMQMSLLRRNMAVLVRLRDTVSNQTIVVANAHLFWNPGFEYVKVRRCKFCAWSGRFKRYDCSTDYRSLSFQCSSIFAAVPSALYFAASGAVSKWTE